MGATWALQDAKNRFSEVVEKALHEGAQTVTRRGVPVVVIQSAEHVSREKRQKGSFAAFFRRSPLFGLELDLSRSRDTGRELPL